MFVVCVSQRQLDFISSPVSTCYDIKGIINVLLFRIERAMFGTNRKGRRDAWNLRNQTWTPETD